MSANLLIPNDYYTIYCNKIITSDAPVQSSETWCYYPSNPDGTGQTISNPVGLVQYPILYSVSAISKNVVVNNDGSIDIIQSGIYRLEVQYTLTFGGSLGASFSGSVFRSGNVIFESQPFSVNANNGNTSVYYSIFFTISKGNTTAIKIQNFLSVYSGGPASGTLDVLGASLSLQRIDEAT